MGRPRIVQPVHRDNASADFEVGRSGEVVARSIEWSKDAAGKTILVANPLN